MRTSESSNRPAVLMARPDTAPHRRRDRIPSWRGDAFAGFDDGRVPDSAVPAGAAKPARGGVSLPAKAELRYA